MTEVQTTAMTVWESPSGRLHGMRGCSGAGPANRLKRRRITRKQYDEHTNRCRCLTFGGFREGK